jgi:hypothetical protein
MAGVVAALAGAPMIAAVVVGGVVATVGQLILAKKL